jgi:hypothetical protein
VTTEPTSPSRPTTSGQAWLTQLAHELFQTEQSAHDHPRVEAERLGDVPPAHAFLAISAHAGEVLAELTPKMKHDPARPAGWFGRTVGAAFSAVRDRLADVLLTRERSYRATLLGLRHGLDLVELIESVALAEGDLELAVWSHRWLEARRPLVEAAVVELAWFARNPTTATEPARRDDPTAVGLQALIRGYRAMLSRLRQPARPMPTPVPADVS